MFKILHIPTARYVNRVYIDGTLTHITDRSNTILKCNPYKPEIDYYKLKNLISSYNLICYDRYDICGEHTLLVLAVAFNVTEINVGSINVYPSNPNMFELIEEND